VDLLLELRDDGEGGDLVVANGDLVLGRPLRGNVFGSLFCDARREDDLPVAAATRDADPRGYWAEEAGDRFGSRLWLREPGKVVPELLPQLEQDARDALQWTLDSGLVRELTVAASRVGFDQVELRIALDRATPLKFQELWDAEDVLEVGPLRLRLLAR
jgi:phage gp46-like protein